MKTVRLGMNGMSDEPFYPLNRLGIQNILCKFAL